MIMEARLDSQLYLHSWRWMLRLPVYFAAWSHTRVRSGVRLARLFVLALGRITLGHVEAELGADFTALGHIPPRPHDENKDDLF